MTQQIFTSERNTFPNASLSYNSLVSYLHFCCLYFQQDIRFWLNHLVMTCVLRIFDSHRFTRCSTIQFLNSLKYLSVQFPSRLLTGNTCFHGAILLFISTRQGRLICFSIFKSSVLFFLETLFFGLCLVNSGCDDSLAADQFSL